MPANLLPLPLAAQPPLQQAPTLVRTQAFIYAIDVVAWVVGFQ